MTAFHQFRSWLQQAPPQERTVTAVVALGLVAVLVTVCQPVTGAAGSPQGPADQSQVGVNGAVAVAGGAPGARLQSAVTGRVLPGGSLGGPGAGVGLGRAATSGGGAPSSVGAASPDGTAGGAGAADQPGTTGSPATANRLTATDRGVSASSVKVGFIMGTLGGITQAGVAADLRSDDSQVIDAIVDDANKHGGINGRSVVAAKTTVDVTSPDSQRQGCLDLTVTDQVFAVLDPATLSFPPGRSCVTVENKTPLLTLLYPGGSDEFATDAPYLLAMSQNDSRRVLNAVQAARANGFFDTKNGFQKLGILSDSCEPNVIDGQDGLKSALRAIGVTAISDFRLDCDISSQQREAPSAVLQFRQDGVTNVFLASNTIADKTFTQSAQAQAFTPHYFLSDFWALVNDVNTKLLQQNQVDGAYGVSEFNHGDPLSFPAVKRCNDVLVAHGLAAIVSFSHDFGAIIACDHLNLLVRAATAVGPDLTRPRFAAAVMSSGPVNPGMVHYDDFSGPGKSSGGDQVQLLQWSMACTCWNIKGTYFAAR